MVYKCDICHRLLASKHGLQGHLLTHTGERPHSCEVCSKTFAQVSALNCHMRTHTGEKPYKCDKCGSCFKHGSHLTIHKRKHTGEKPYVCKVCTKSFPRIDSLNRHMKTHNKGTKQEPLHEGAQMHLKDPYDFASRTMVDNAGNVQNYLCKLCGRVFEYGYEFEFHLREEHVEPGPTPGSVVGSTPGSTPVSMVGTTQAPIAMVGSSQSTTSSPSTSSDVSSVADTSQQNSKDQRRVVNTVIFECGVCNKLLQSKHGLQGHLLTHTGERPYVCDVCNKSFTQNSALNCHMRTHTGEKPFKCDVCSLSFKHASHLTVHMRKHTGERPYDCKTCGKAFARIDSLNRHANVHEAADQREYSCNQCGEWFKSFSAYKSHMKNQHVKLNSPPSHNPVTLADCNQLVVLKNVPPESLSSSAAVASTSTMEQSNNFYTIKPGVFDIQHLVKERNEHPHHTSHTSRVLDVAVAEAVSSSVACSTSVNSTSAVLNPPTAAVMAQPAVNMVAVSSAVNLGTLQPVPTVGRPMQGQHPVPLHAGIQVPVQAPVVHGVHGHPKQQNVILQKAENSNLNFMVKIEVFDDQEVRYET